MSRGLAFCAAVGAVLAASPAAFAQWNRPTGEDGYHKHQGLFMRIDGGGGYLKTSATVSGSNLSLSGPAGTVGFSIRGNVIGDLGLLCPVGHSLRGQPTVSSGGPSTCLRASSPDLAPLRRSR